MYTICYQLPLYFLIADSEKSTGSQVGVVKDDKPRKRKVTFAAVKDAKVRRVNTKDSRDVHNIKQGLCFAYPLSHSLNLVYHRLH